MKFMFLYLFLLKLSPKQVYQLKSSSKPRQIKMFQKPIYIQCIISGQRYNLQMETENQEIYRTQNKHTAKQQLNSFHIFEPDYFINSAFTLTDSEQRLSSKILDQPFSLTPLKPSRNMIDGSKLYLKEKPEEVYDSSMKVKKTATPSIENIVIEYQKNQNDSKPLKLFNPCKIQDMFNNKPQFSSMEIKTLHLTKQIGLQLKKPESIESQSFQQECCESYEDAIQRKNVTSLKYIQASQKCGKCTGKPPISGKLNQLIRLQGQVEQLKQENKQLENISQFLKSFAKNKRDVYVKDSKKKVDWNIVKKMIDKELKFCANS